MRTPMILFAILCILTQTHAQTPPSWGGNPRYTVKVKCRMTIQFSTGPSLITTTAIRKFKGTSTKHPPTRWSLPPSQYHFQHRRYSLQCHNGYWWMGLSDLPNSKQLLLQMYQKFWQHQIRLTSSKQFLCWNRDCWGTISYSLDQAGSISQSLLLDSR